MKDNPEDLDVTQFDPILLESIERSLDSPKRIFSPALIKVLREQALVQLSTDPQALGLVAKLRARQPVQEGGANPIEEVREGDVDPEPPASDGNAGGRPE